MRLPLLLAAAAGLALAGTLAAQSVETVAPGNNWVLDGDCSIYAEWDGNVTVAVNRHDDHYDLGVYDPRWHVTNDKIVKVSIAPATGAAEAHDALGRKDAEWTGYVADVGEALVDRIAASGALTLSRGKEVLADLDVAGMTVAREKQRACLAALPADDGMNVAVGYDNVAVGYDNVTDAAMDAEEAAEAAAEAATEEPMMEAVDNQM